MSLVVCISYQLKAKYDNFIPEVDVEFMVVYDVIKKSFGRDETNAFTFLVLTANPQNTS